jgi:hypothetical protein
MPPPPVPSHRPDLANPHHVSLILRHRNKILVSPQFILSRQLQQFLDMLVMAALESGAHPSSETATHAEAHRPPSQLAPANHAMVRPDPSRLRRKLNQYYNSGGVWDTVRFTLRKGGRVLDIEFIPEGHAAGPAAPTKFRPPWAPPPRTLILIALATTALVALAAVACHRF